MTLQKDRLLAVVLGRAGTSPSRSHRELSRALQRFAPKDVETHAWESTIEAIVRDAVARELIGPDGRAASGAVREHLGKIASGATWRQLADRWLPMLGLGVPRDDTKVASRLKDRDAWTGAIAGRLLGIWVDGLPPSLSSVCDTFTWRRLRLSGKPKRCPPEVRAHFLGHELAIEGAQPDRLLRLYVARELEAQRPEIRALRDALVRRWLEGAPLLSTSPATNGSLLDAAMRAAHATTRGVFGDRKVFISAVWERLRHDPSWVKLELDAFKQQLVAGHRRGDVVLARADLVAAMDPALVAASETSVDGASFHFIVRGDAA